MNNSVKELFTSYPFLPCQTTDDTIRNIRDVRIVYIMPAGDPVYASNNLDGIKVTLSSIASTVAIFNIVISQYNIQDSIRVPVYTGIDTYPTTQSYVIVDKPVSSVLLSHEYRLHPDCLIVLQQPPTISVQLRYDISTSFSATTETITIAGPSLSFVKGNHVSVKQTGSTVTWYGVQGGGLGAFTTFPYSEFAGKTVEYGKGLRSINGNYGNVLITTKGSSVALTIDRNSITRTTTVTVGSK